MTTALQTRAASDVRSLRTIVVATDFSASARAAVAWAERLARQHGATLVLVHALRHEPPPASEFERSPSQYRDESRGSAQSRLEGEAERAHANGVTVECELGCGPASDVVLAAAERRGADVLVAGTRGRTEWKRVLLGSTAARLVATAHCPVLSVHATHTDPRPVRTVLVPTDFSDDATLAADAARRILGSGADDRRIVLLHAYHVSYEARCLPAPVLDDALAAADATARRMIAERAAALRHTGIQVDAITRDADPFDAIVEHADAVHADLIAMGTQGLSGLNRLLLGSTAERVVAAAPCPVLTVRRAVA